MKVFYVLTIFLFLSVSSVLAQSNFKPGYIVSLQGDTSKGLIDYHEWANNPESVNFKTTNNTKTKITVENTKAFGANGLEYYERFVTDVSQDAVDLSNLIAKPANNTKTDTIFLRTLTKGSHVSLYEYIDKIKTRYFIANGTANAEELVYGQYADPENSQRIVAVNRFRVQLQNAVQSASITNSKLSNQIQNASYSQTELLKIVKAINGNTDKAFTPESKFGTRLFAGLGVNSNKLTWIINYPLPLNAHQSQVAPVVNAGIDLLLNKNTKRFYIRAEASYSMAKYSFNAVKFGGFNEGEYVSGTLSEVRMSVLSFSPQIYYNLYSTDNFQFFASIGFAVNVIGYKKSIYDRLNPRSTYVSTPVRIGATITKKIQIYAGYSQYMSDLRYNRITTIQGGINYLFQ